MSASTSVTRRKFLKTASTGGAAFVIGFYLKGDIAAQDQKQEKPVPNPFNAWVRIEKDDQVTLILAKSEMGQGVMTALPMILAEELGLDWKKVKIEQAPTDPDIYNLGTGGSSSVHGSWLPLRRAGAAAREMLISAAAIRWNVDRAACRVENGSVFHGARDRQFRYGELVEAASKLSVPNLNTVPLKNADNFTIVGKATRRVDTPIKVDGSARFGIDTRVPGMLFAVIARPRTFGGKVVRFDAAKARAVPGVRDVFAIEPVGRDAFTAGGVAVVADSSWAALQGRRALDIEWDHGPNATESSETLQQQFLELARKAGKIVRNDGDAETALANVSRRIEAAYQLPFAAHATMEPMNCTVYIGADRTEAWVPTQSPDWARDMIAKIAGIPVTSVNVHTTLMGGGFGRRSQADFVVEAAQISKEVRKPIQVLWTREDDLQYCFYRPASYHKLSAALDAQGNLLAWKHFLTSPSISAWWDAPETARPESTEIGGAGYIPYFTANNRLEYALAQSGVPRSWWRSVEESSSGFVVESFVDELAAAAAADPLEFRLRLIGEPRKIPFPAFLGFTSDPLDTERLKTVLRLAASRAGWGKPLPKGRGRGIAGFFSYRTYAAMVAEVVVNDGQVRVERAVVAVDCGRPINPDGIHMQAEGAVIFGLTAALKSAITVDKGAVVQSNFHNYEVLRMNEAPLTEVHIVASQEKPTGMGEPVVPVVAPSVCNAIFAATGKRLRRLPVRAADLEAY
jgi:isoquinoline 1-oxidoreductase subunit beta